ncbi:hypothetical protein [Campylobacter sp.]|uniref:hypothetical protein n=1 Tax=Campylobacter sp. TaxID=205 RepID=UPI0025B8C5C5|nr:hypothetical protein [Campylobacter sp.]
MSRAASRLKQGAILNFKSERAAALNFNAAASTVLNFKRTAALNSKPGCMAPLNFRSRCDGFYRAFLVRGSCGTVIASDEILSSRGKNFKAYGKRGGVKFLKSVPKFEGKQKEGCDAKHR